MKSSPSFVKANSKHITGWGVVLLEQRVPVNLCAVCSDTKEEFSDCQNVLCVGSLTIHFNGNMKCCENIES